MKKFLSILAVLIMLGVPAFAQDTTQPAQDQTQPTDQATPPADQSGSGDTLGQAPADTGTAEGEQPAQEPAAGDAMGTGEATDTTGAGDTAETGEAADAAGDATGTGETADTAASGDTLGQGGNNGLPENLVRLGELQDMSLGSGDQNQGNVEDVVLTADGKVSHVIASLQGIEGIDDGRYLVPFESLQAGQDQLQVSAVDASGLELLAEGIRPTGIAKDAILLSALMDYRLINNRQEELDGNIEDVVADRQSGDILYIAVNLGGTLGAGGKLAAVPYSEVWYNLTDKTVAIDIAADQVDQVTGFEDNQWPAQADSNWRPAGASSGPYQGPSLGSGETVEEPAADAAAGEGEAMTPAPEAGADAGATTGDTATTGDAATGDTATTPDATAPATDDAMGAGDAAGEGEAMTPAPEAGADAGAATGDAATGDAATTTTTTVP